MEAASIIQMLLALAFVIGLIGLASLALRYFGGERMLRSQMDKDRTSKLKVLDMLPLDPKRRLVLVQCGKDEHLLLLSHDKELLVSSTSLQAPAQVKSTASEKPKGKSRI